MLTVADLVYALVEKQYVADYVRKFVIDKSAITVIVIRDSNTKPFELYTERDTGGFVDNIIVSAPNNMKRGWNNIKGAQALNFHDIENAYGALFLSDLKRSIARIFGRVTRKND